MAAIFSSISLTIRLTNRQVIHPFAIHSAGLGLCQHTNTHSSFCTYTVVQLYTVVTAFEKSLALSKRKSHSMAVYYTNIVHVLFLTYRMFDAHIILSELSYNALPR